MGHQPTNGNESRFAADGAASAMVAAASAAAKMTTRHAREHLVSRHVARTGRRARGRPTNVGRLARTVAATACILPPVLWQPVPWRAPVASSRLVGVGFREEDRGSQSADNRIRRRCVCAGCPRRTAAAQVAAPTPTPAPVVTAGGGRARRLQPGDGRPARLRAALRRGGGGAARLAAARAREDALAAPTRSCSWAPRARRTTSPPRRACGARRRSTCACRSARRPGRSRSSIATARVSVPSVGAGGARGHAAPAAAPSVELAVRAPRAYYDAAAAGRADLRRARRGAGDVGVDVVRVLDGVVIAHWDVAAGGAGDRAARDVGRHAPAACVQPDGELRLPGHAVGSPASRAAARRPAAFDFAQRPLPDPRPVQVRHRRRRRSAAAAATRARTSFAACGTPLVAAHGGMVKYAGYHGARRQLPRDRQRGRRTPTTPTCTCATSRWSRPAIACAPGSRSASSARPAPPARCHLHFEIWTAPGWYSGGAPIDPLPTLRSWR